MNTPTQATELTTLLTEAIKALRDRCSDNLADRLEERMNKALEVPTESI
jgi:hypothetical protein